MHIAIIEDDPVLCELTRTAISLEGNQVSVFKNGEDGIEYLKDHIDQVDIILLDLYMPVLDGVYVLDWLRNTMKVSTPVVVMTAMTDEITENNIISAGADRVIKKPLDIKMLLSAIEGVRNR